ncbi:hypothetical protein NW762_012064 [Fusarium torreyae]|uniref:Uncharacterized protein n=1 Tax=Fusarium torreyae TaxID=1237075 RepID=A0A9W8RNJ5_9HYPO|nr:hypothetical protein NW762_012064 [Fusarium torreyae]
MRRTVRSLFENTPCAKALLYIWEKVFEDYMQKVCLMFFDQQLITGASILIVGYSTHCDIMQYHFYIAANLGMACFAKFQALLPIVRSELDDRLKKG